MKKNTLYLFILLLITGLNTSCNYLDIVPDETATEKDAFANPRVYEARGSYQHGKQFSTWAFAMAYNLCKNEYRHRDIVDEYRLQQSYTNEEDSYSSLEFEVAHDRQVFDRQLKKVLAGLTDEQRAAYTLRYEEELPVQEIAQILCCPEGTVKSRLYYTLKVLQRSLSDYNPQK